MNKKAFHAAFDRAKSGEFEEALMEMSSDRPLAKGRLKHLMKYGGDDAALAGQLWERLFPTQPMDHVQAPIAARPELTTSAPAPAFLDLERPEGFLRWTTSASPTSPPLVIEMLSVAQVWGLVGLAALGQPARSSRPPIQAGGKSGAARFAHALGLDALLGGHQPPRQIQSGRTVPLKRVERREQIDPTAEEMAQLIVPGAATDERRTVRYVLVELMRNVVQHSEDPLGGVVAAQLMTLGQAPYIQVAVADAGIGIPESLQRMHTAIDPRAALERALWPHISGTFPEGLTGSGENAGLGLFFIAEMAKMTGGSLLIATRGATLVIDHTGATHTDSTVRFLPHGLGFPGTLVAFELPMAGEIEYDLLIRTITDRARERTPKRAVNHWIRFSSVVEDVGSSLAIRVADLRENTLRAAALAQDTIVPAILKKQRVVLDFTGIEICTQSYLHALLYEAVRIAWATRSVIHVLGADAPVRSGIEFLEAYALGG